MKKNFYGSHDYTNLEIAVCLEDTKDSKGKFYIPALMPLLEHKDAYDKKDPPISTSNILSDASKLNIKQCTISNYIDMYLPEYIDKAKKGDKFVISFIGGDINKPYIIGRFNVVK